MRSDVVDWWGTPDKETAQMAAPDYDFRPDMIDWSIQPDYTVEDRDFFCSMTGLPKGRDEVVYRGSMIDFEGFFSISQYSAEQLAKLIGWIDPDTLVSTPEEELLIENVRLREEADDLRARIEEILAVVAS